MIKKTKSKISSAYHMMGAAMTVGMMGMMSSDAHAQLAGNNVTNFSSISTNITESIRDIPGMVSSVSYLVGLLLSVLGIMKIKDHVENPTQTPLKDGAIRLTAGGALFALPILTSSMLGTIDGGDGDGPAAAGLVNRININDTFNN